MKRNVYKTELRGRGEYDYGFIVVDNNKNILERTRPLFSNYNQQFVPVNCNDDYIQVKPEDITDDRYSKEITYSEFGESNIRLGIADGQIYIYLQDFTGYISIYCGMINRSEQEVICEKTKFKISEDNNNLIMDLPYWQNGIYTVKLFPSENEVWKYFVKPIVSNLLNVLCCDYTKVFSS